MKKKLLIYGAGAIGRGYLPWVFSGKHYDFYFVDVNKSLISLLKKKNIMSHLKLLIINIIQKKYILKMYII